MPQQAPPLREQQRTATHRAIVAAAVDTVAQVGVDRITAELVAEAAGVSRRTLFNYFPSVDALLMAPIGDLVACAGEALSQRPAGQPLSVAIDAALSTGATQREFRQLAQFLVSVEDPETLRRMVLSQVDRWETQVSEVLCRRFPERTDPVYIDTLAAAISGAGRAAFKAWIADGEGMAQGTRSRRGRQERLGQLGAHILRAISFLAPMLDAPPVLGCCEGMPAAFVPTLVEG